VKIPLAVFSLTSLTAAQAVGDLIYAAIAWPVTWLGQAHAAVPVLRPILFLPGTLLAALAQIFTCWLPNYGTWSDRALKITAVEAWPNSQYALRSFNEIAAEIRDYEQVNISRELDEFVRRGEQIDEFA
jgi:hypothetical protein